MLQGWNHEANDASRTSERWPYNDDDKLDRFPTICNPFLNRVHHLCPLFHQLILFSSHIIEYRQPISFFTSSKSLTPKKGEDRVFTNASLSQMILEPQKYHNHVFFKCNLHCSSLLGNVLYAFFCTAIKKMKNKYILIQIQISDTTVGF